jgi:hypothetical protein
LEWRSGHSQRPAFRFGADASANPVILAEVG